MPLSLSAEHILTALKILPGIALFPATYILAKRKFSHKAEVFYTAHLSIAHADRISRLLVRNLKDKPLEIFAIHAVIDGDLTIELIQNETPTIIKSLECLDLILEPISFYTTGDQHITNLGLNRRVEFYITTADKVIKCRSAALPTAMQIRQFGFGRICRPVRNRHNSLVYSPDATHAIDYTYDGVRQTSFLLSSGYIYTQEEQYRIGHGIPKPLSSELMQDLEALKQLLFEYSDYDGVTDISIVALR